MPLRYRAGPVARRTLRERGLTAETLAAVVGPASGPKWIVLAALDRALVASGLLDGSTGPRRPLLVGASAGAWRMLALAAHDPLRAHRELLEGYVGMRFPPRTPPPAAISAAYRSMLARIFPPAERERLAAHPAVYLAIHTVRGGPFAPRVAQLAALAASAALHAIGPTGGDRIFRRVLFHSAPQRFGAPFAGTIVRLDAANLLPAAVATGTVPVYMEPPREPPGAPRGRYLDGGLSDYHLRQRYAAPGDDGIVLLPHFQRRIVPSWFDRSHARRAPPRDALDNVLQLHPSDELVASLPDGRVPDREDFFRFAADPDARIAQWRLAEAAGERLAERFLEDLEAQRIGELVEPL